MEKIDYKSAVEGLFKLFYAIKFMIRKNEIAGNYP